jgi:hypothetical protein
LKSLRVIERCAIHCGSQGFCPSINCIARNSSGMPSRADVPGGVGSTFGKANTSINAPKARSPITESMSPTETRSRASSPARACKMPVSLRPEPRFLNSGRGMRGLSRRLRGLPSSDPSRGFRAMLHTFSHSQSSLTDER